MCGFSGEVRFDGGRASVATVERMTGALAPRGPDAAGMLAHEHAAIGHRRLRIIDLSARAQQPLVDPELGLSLVFNGCIYNYRELRKQLRGRGYRFFSDSDTEVIAKAYAEWGPRCAERLSGMFAFAIVERDSGRVVLCRDRLGIKPLYLAHDPGNKRLRFASTLPALLAGGDIDTGIDPVALHHYMSFHTVVPAPFSILNGVRKLPPGSYAVFEPDGRRDYQHYWRLDFNRDEADMRTSSEEWRERVAAALRLAVERRMIADVPVGVLLSGGVDSSLIVALLAEQGQRELATFSVGFESVHGEAGDEFSYSDRVAGHFDTRHHKLQVSTRGILDALPRVIEAMAEPMASHDNVGFYLLAEQVSQHVKVVQSGQGADEVFGGYHWYPPLARSNHPLGDYEQAFFDRDQAEMDAAIAPAYREENYSRAFVQGHFDLPGADDPVDKALRLDTTVMLPDDPVKRLDNMTMAWGLEARVPFLDHELVELAARIPPQQKLRDDGKGILKDVARQALPVEVVDRPKGYFPVPALKYLEGDCLALVREVLDSRAARDRGVFEPGYVQMLLDDPTAHITPLRGSKLWQIAMLESWLQTHGI